MEVTVSNNIYISQPSVMMLNWCKENLIIPNPEYAKKLRMGFSTRGVPQKLSLYQMDGKNLVLPFGVLGNIVSLLEGATVYDGFVPHKPVIYPGHIPLYDYQEVAVHEAENHLFGILQSPPGSGKTQMGIALIQRLGRRALWVTHTKDLLTQSRERAEQYFPKELMGEITEGRVKIGTGITFATVQTLSKLDLTAYRNVWDVIVVDECHRVCGTPTAMSQFYKVLNNLSARHKYGLSATVHRADGMIKATYSILGEVFYSVPEEAVAERIMKVKVRVVDTGLALSRKAFNSDGTLSYTKFINSLVDNGERNQVILNQLSACKGKSCLILSDRVEHLMELMDTMPLSMRADATRVDGSMTTKRLKACREQAIKDMRSGEKKYLFATYSLAKEGLDIPRLERLFLTTPHTDYAVIAQSIGRVDRTFPGKEQPIAYDFVDYDPHSEKYFRKRCTTYRKCGCIVERGR